MINSGEGREYIEETERIPDSSECDTAVMMKKRNISESNIKYIKLRRGIRI